MFKCDWNAEVCSSDLNICGPAVTLSLRSGLNWSKCANTYANKKPRMEQTDSSEPLTKARFSATPKIQQVTAFEAVPLSRKPRYFEINKLSHVTEVFCRQRRSRRDRPPLIKPPTL